MSEVTYTKREVWLPRARWPERYLAVTVYRFSDGVVYIAVWDKLGQLREMFRA